MQTSDELENFYNELQSLIPYDAENPFLYDLQNSTSYDPQDLVLDELQPPFSYSIYPIIVVIILLIILTICFFMKKNEKANFKRLPEVKEINLKDLNVIKRKYLKQLEEINNRLNVNEMSTRIAYQNISSILRFFVYEVTNIKVSHYTLRDIKKLNIPILYELIQEYYAPEFSRHSLGDIKSSLEKTRKVIERWS